MAINGYTPRLPPSKGTNHSDEKCLGNHRMLGLDLTDSHHPTRGEETIQTASTHPSRDQIGTGPVRRRMRRRPVGHSVPPKLARIRFIARRPGRPVPCFESSGNPEAEPLHNLPEA